MNNMLNSIDNDSNDPSNNHIICNTVEDNTSTAINALTTTDPPICLNDTLNDTLNDLTLRTNDTLNDPITVPTMYEYLENIKNGIKPNTELHCHPEIIRIQESFNELIFKHKVHYCQYYHERWYDLKGSYSESNIFECDLCKKTLANETISVHLYSDENNMDPKLYLIYNHLPKLNDIEEMFISRVYVVMSVYRLSKGNIGYKENVLNMQQDVQAVLTKLPQLLSDLPIFIARKSNSNCPNGYKDFIINREKILRWLVFLKNNNEHYKDI